LPGPYDYRLHFRDRAQAWSEHYLYFPDDALATVMIAAQQLAVARVALHNPTITLYHASVRDRENPANRYAWNPQEGSRKFGLPPVIPPNNWPLPDNPFSAVLVTLETEGLPLGRIFMSGISDDFILDQALNFPKPWQDAFEVFRQCLTQTGGFGKLQPAPCWGVDGRDKDPADFPVSDVTAIRLVQNWEVTTVAVNWVEGDRVQLSGALFLPPGVRGNKIYSVLQVAAPVSTLLATPAGITAYLGQGTLQKVGKTVYKITDAWVDRPVRHKRGAGYAPPRGRAPAKK